MKSIAMLDHAPIGHNRPPPEHHHLLAAPLVNSAPMIAGPFNKRKFKPLSMTPAAVRKRRSRAAAIKGLSPAYTLRVTVQTLAAIVVDLKAKRIRPDSKNIAQAMADAIEASFQPKPPARK